MVSGCATAPADLVGRLLDRRRALLARHDDLETLPDLKRWDVRILATDLDSDVLERARRGVYARTG